MTYSKPRLAVIACVTALAFFAAHADTAEGAWQPEPLVAAKSRAAVQAELIEFRKARVDPWSTRFDLFKHARSERTRDEVRAEAHNSRGHIRAFTGEDSGSADLAGGNAHRGDRGAETVAGFGASD